MLMLKLIGMACVGTQVIGQLSERSESRECKSAVKENSSEFFTYGTRVYASAHQRYACFTQVRTKNFLVARKNRNFGLEIFSPKDISFFHYGRTEGLFCLSQNSDFSEPPTKKVFEMRQHLEGKQHFSKLSGSSTTIPYGTSPKCYCKIPSAQYVTQKVHFGPSCYDSSCSQNIHFMQAGPNCGRPFFTCSNSECK